jgi:uncharacterized membrane protein
VTPADRTRLAAQAATAALLAWILVEPAAGDALAAPPLVALLVAGWRRARYWAIAAASLMLAYFSYGVMALMTTPGNRPAALAYCVLTLLVFFAALDSERRRRFASATRVEH